MMRGPIVHDLCVVTKRQTLDNEFHLFFFTDHSVGLFVLFCAADLLLQRSIQGMLESFWH